MKSETRCDVCLSSDSMSWDELTHITQEDPRQGITWRQAPFY